MITSNIKDAINALREIQELIKINDPHESYQWCDNIFSITDDAIQALHEANNGITAAESALKGVINEL